MSMSMSMSMSDVHMPSTTASLRVSFARTYGSLKFEMLKISLMPSVAEGHRGLWRSLL